MLEVISTEPATRPGSGIYRPPVLVDTFDVDQDDEELILTLLAAVT